MTERFQTVTSIDIAALFDPAAQSAGRTARAVADALVTQGGFVATGFPGGSDIDARMRRLLAFFDLPLDQKMACTTRRHDARQANINRGYVPTPEKRGWAFNEVFDIGPAVIEGVDPALAGRTILEEPTQWPAHEPYAGWQEEARALFDDMVGLCRGVLAGMMTGLGLEPLPALAMCRRNNATLRLLHYPPVPGDFLAGEGATVPQKNDELGRRIMTHRHLDMNLHSLLWQEPVGGLQMQAPDGTWREVPADRGGISVHNGAMIEALTGGRVRGTPHRVAGPTGDRCSVGMFHEPDYDAVMTPAGGVAETYARTLLRQYATYEDFAPFIPAEVAA